MTISIINSKTRVAPDAVDATVEEHVDVGSPTTEPSAAGGGEDGLLDKLSAAESGVATRDLTAEDTTAVEMAAMGTAAEGTAAGSEAEDGMPPPPEE